MGMRHVIIVHAYLIYRLVVFLNTCRDPAEDAGITSPDSRTCASICPIASEEIRGLSINSRQTIVRIRAHEATMGIIFG